MKVLFVPAATQQVAATRYRIYQYLPYLEAHGVEYRVFPLHAERLSRDAIASPTFGPLRTLRYYLELGMERLGRALVVLWLARRYDVVLFQRATVGWRLERLLRCLNDRIIFDIDDPLFTDTDGTGSWMVRWKTRLRQRELRQMLAMSRCTIVESEYVGQYARQFCPRVELIPGPIDTRRYTSTPLSEQLPTSNVVLGWIGSPATTPYLRLLDGVLQALRQHYPITVTIIGATPYVLDGVEMTWKPWRLETEVVELRQFDIGLMPLPDDSWTQGKLSAKLLQYFAAGLPVVASAVGVNREVITDGVDGFLATDEREWVEKLSLLIEDASLRRRMGEQGRQLADERFSLEVNAPRFLQVLREISASPCP